MRKTSSNKTSVTVSNDKLNKTKPQTESDNYDELTVRYKKGNIKRQANEEQANRENTRPGTRLWKQAHKGRNKKFTAQVATQKETNEMQQSRAR